LFDLIVSNCETTGDLAEGLQWVEASSDLDEYYAVYRSSLTDPEVPHHHNSEKLAQALIAGGIEPAPRLQAAQQG
jgi:hypothetical protein